VDLRHGYGGPSDFNKSTCYFDVCREKLECMLASQYSNLGVFTNEFFKSPAFQVGYFNNYF